MAISHPKRKFLWMISLAVAVLAAPEVLAVLRPVNPIMDYVPQNYGRYDTYYVNCTETDCRTCHGSSTAERHHATQLAASGQCLECHCDFPDVVPPERDCFACHVDSAEFCGLGQSQGGDYGWPHHRSDESASNQCTACHSPKFLVETFTVDPPGYIPTSITPTPFACENCHWPSGRLPGEAAVYEPANQPPTLTTGQREARFLQDWQTWPNNVVRNNLGDGNAYPGDGWPKPTYTDSGPDPQPIGPSGAFFWIDWELHPTKPYIPPAGKQLHMQEGLTMHVGVARCYICHGSSPSETGTSWDPEDPYLIRYCENCHDIGTLHNIADMVVDNDIYTVGGTLGQSLTANEKCVACHGDVLPEWPDVPEASPLIKGTVPSFASPGVIVQIHGSNFGIQSDGDQVEMKTVVASIPSWEAVPIYSWAEDLIEIFVPGNNFWPGLSYSTNLRVRKHVDGALDKKSTSENFVVKNHPKIDTMAAAEGNWGTKINLNGEGFNNKQEKIYDLTYATNKAGFGYSTYVELTASNDKYRCVLYTKPTGAPMNWQDSDIAVRLGKIGVLPYDQNVADILTGTWVPESQLYEGDWQLTVVTDYFKDDGDLVYFDPATGSLDLEQIYLDENEPWNALDGAHGTGTGDILLHRERSMPQVFTIIHNPIVNRVKPRTGAYKGNTVKLLGYGFGTAFGTVDVGNKTMSSFKSATIKSWGTTKIVFKMPRFAAGKVGKKRWIRVNVPGNGSSDWIRDNSKVKYLGITP